MLNNINKKTDNVNDDNQEINNVLLPQDEYLLSLSKSHDKFTDQFGVPYVRFEKDGHFEIQPLESKAYEHHLIQELYKIHGNRLNQKAVDRVISIIGSEIISNRVSYKLHIRIAWYNDAIWYDLADPLWRAIRIDESGRCLVQKPPILFKRMQHMQEQVVPVSGGKISTLFDFINVPKEFRLLLLADLMSSFIPDIDYPITVFWGKPGTGKTSACRVLKSLVDPSIADVLSLPGTEKEMVQVMSKNHMTVFDNISRISAKESDILCRASTGGAFMNRTLFQNDDDLIRELHQPVVLNGLYQLGVANDLISRCIFFELEKINSPNMITTTEFFEKFNQEKPLILGKIFDCISKSMKNKKDIKITHHKRMGDFTDWSVAIAKNFKEGDIRILRQLGKMDEIRNREALLGQPLANAVEIFLKQRKYFKGSATDLYLNLCDIAKANKINTKHPAWPNDVNVMTRFLNNLQANLEQAGILYEHSRKKSGAIIELKMK